MEGHLILFSHPTPSEAAKPPKPIPFRVYSWTHDNRSLSKKASKKSFEEGQAEARGPGGGQGGARGAHFFEPCSLDTLLWGVRVLLALPPRKLLVGSTAPPRYGGGLGPEFRVQGSGFRFGPFRSSIVEFTNIRVMRRPLPSPTSIVLRACKKPLVGRNLLLQTAAHNMELPSLNPQEEPPTSPAFLARLVKAWDLGHGQMAVVQHTSPNPTP